MPTLEGRVNFADTTCSADLHYFVDHYLALSGTQDIICGVNNVLM